MHRRETARAGAAQEAEQKRFGLIVAGVAEGDEIRAKRRSRAASSIDRRRSRANAATSPRSLANGRPSRSAIAAANRSSALDVSRS